METAEWQRLSSSEWCSEPGFLEIVRLFTFINGLPCFANFPSALNESHNFLWLLWTCFQKYLFLEKIRIGSFFSPGMSDHKLDEMIAKADVDNNGWVGCINVFLPNDKINADNLITWSVFTAPSTTRSLLRWCPPKWNAFSHLLFFSILRIVVKQVFYGQADHKLL